MQRSDVRIVLPFSDRNSVLDNAGKSFKLSYVQPY